MKDKLIYVLPEASVNTHMKYNVEFIKHLSSRVDIFLILEKSSGEFNAEQIKKELGVSEVKLVGTNKFTRFAPVRLLRTFLFLWLARTRGYTQTYVHYSFAAVLAAAAIPGLRIYYWNCGMPYAYTRPYFQEQYQRLVYRLIDVFVTGQPVLVDTYSTYYGFNPAKASVVPNWIDVAHMKEEYQKANPAAMRAELNIKEGQKVLFFMQRLSERKGAHYLPIIAERLRKEYSENFVIIVTGDGPYKQKLEEQIAEKGMQKNFRVLGRISNHKMPSIFSVTDIFLLASDEEGMSHALMEAMSTGTAAVSFDVGGTKDMYPDNIKEFVAPAKDIHIFITRVIELLNNDIRRAEVGKALAEKVMEYDKSAILDQFYKKIVQGQR